jgi:hypothetical protein
MTDTPTVWKLAVVAAVLAPSQEMSGPGRGMMQATNVVVQ